MKVKAIKKGFYKKLRRVGDEFFLTSRLDGATKSQDDKDIKLQFSENWMVKVVQQKTKNKD